MQQLKTYHRPETIEETLALLTRPGIKAALIAGGTYGNAHRDENIEEIVDLQSVGLDQIHMADKRLVIQAMVNLQTIVDDPATPDLLKQMINQEFSNTFRHAATIGGVVAGADWESEVLTALLVMEAEVTIQTSGGTKSVSLPDFLADVTGSLAGGLITAVSILTGGKTAHARVARTPKDKPIVAAAACQKESGHTVLALCGVAAFPTLADPDHLTDLNPPDDFRGSSHYRAQMAEVLTRRVLRKLEG